MALLAFILVIEFMKIPQVSSISEAGGVLINRNGFRRSNSEFEDQIVKIGGANLNVYNIAYSSSALNQLQDNAIYGGNVVGSVNGNTASFINSIDKNDGTSDKEITFKLLITKQSIANDVMC